MSYPYGTKGAPAVGKGLGGLPRRASGEVLPDATMWRNLNTLIRGGVVAKDSIILSNSSLSLVKTHISKFSGAKLEWCTELDVSIGIPELSSNYAPSVRFFSQNTVFSLNSNTGELEWATVVGAVEGVTILGIASNSAGQVFVVSRIFSTNSTLYSALLNANGSLVSNFRIGAGTFTGLTVLNDIAVLPNDEVIACFYDNQTDQDSWLSKISEHGSATQQRVQISQTSVDTISPVLKIHRPTGNLILIVDSSSGTAGNIIVFDSSASFTRLAGYFIRVDTGTPSTVGGHAVSDTGEVFYATAATGTNLSLVTLFWNGTSLSVQQALEMTGSNDDPSSLSNLVAYCDVEGSFYFRTNQAILKTGSSVEAGDFLTGMDGNASALLVDITGTTTLTSAVAAPTITVSTVNSSTAFSLTSSAASIGGVRYDPETVGTVFATPSGTIAIGAGVIRND